jgi:hypothetical protein
MLLRKVSIKHWLKKTCGSRHRLKMTSTKHWLKMTSCDNVRHKGANKLSFQPRPPRPRPPPFARPPRPRPLGATGSAASPRPRPRPRPLPTTAGGATPDATMQHILARFQRRRAQTAKLRFMRASGDQAAQLDMFKRSGTRVTLKELQLEP